MDKNVWVVDDDESIRWVLEKGLSDGGMDVQTFDSANKVIKKLETENFGDNHFEIMCEISKVVKKGKPKAITSMIISWFR